MCGFAEWPIELLTVIYLLHFFNQCRAKRGQGVDKEIKFVKAVTPRLSVADWKFKFYYLAAVGNKDQVVAPTLCATVRGFDVSKDVRCLVG